MKKLQVLLLLALTSTLLLFGCQDKEKIEQPALNPIEETTPAAESSEVTEETQPAVTETPAPDLPPAEGMVRSKLTNEWIDEETAEMRPIAVMIPNTKTASQYGISTADIVYECNVESSITRLMGIWEDWDEIEKVGNIRSARDYFVYWAFEWDALLVHYGGPFYMDDLIARDDTQNIDLNVDTSKTYHSRDNAKNTYDNAFTNAELLKDYIKDKDYPSNYREGYTDEQHFTFASDQEPNTLENYPDAITANMVDMSLAYPLTNCYFIYNEETGLYDRFQHLTGESDGPHIDLASNEQLAFKNILIQNTYYEIRDQKGYLAFQCHDTTRDGWFFTNGKGIHVTWEKVADYSATRYYDDNGNEIKLNTGKTMICIVEDGDVFTVDGKIVEAK